MRSSQFRAIRSSIVAGTVRYRPFSFFRTGRPSSRRQYCSAPQPAPNGIPPRESTFCAPKSPSAGTSFHLSSAWPGLAHGAATEDRERGSDIVLVLVPKEIDPGRRHGILRRDSPTDIITDCTQRSFYLMGQSLQASSNRPQIPPIMLQIVPYSRYFANVDTVLCSKYLPRLRRPNSQTSSFPRPGLAANTHRSNAESNRLAQPTTSRPAKPLLSAPALAASHRSLVDTAQHNLCHRNITRTVLQYCGYATSAVGYSTRNIPFDLTIHSPTSGFGPQQGGFLFPSHSSTQANRPLRKMNSPSTVCSITTACSPALSIPLSTLLAAT